MRSAAVTALLVGSVLACGAAAGSPRAPAAQPAAAAFSYWGGPFDLVLTSSVDWGDYDGDGDLDLLLAGSVVGGLVTWVYRNDGGLSFTRLPDMFVHVSYCSAKWGDFDGDGDLDILLAGLTYANATFTKIYRNDGAATFVDMGPVSAGCGRRLGGLGRRGQRRRSRHPPDRITRHLYAPHVKGLSKQRGRNLLGYRSRPGRRGTLLGILWRL